MAERNNAPPRMTALGLLEQMRRRANANREAPFDPIAASARERGQAPRAPLFGGQRQQAALPIPPTPPAVIPPPQPQRAAPQARGQAQALPVPPVPPAVIPQQEGAPATPIAERFNPQNPHVATAIEMAERYNLPRNVFLSLVQQESRFRPDAVSRAGALGLGQLMPGTARDLGVDPTNPEQNLEGSARYLRQQLDRFGGDMTLALAAYNAGPRRVAEAGNAIPDIAETRAYVPSVMRRAGVPGYAEGGTVDSMPVHEINVVATRLPRRRAPRRAPREELTADQLNAMVLDRLAARYDVAPESIMAAEARERIGRAMGYAEGGRVNSDWSRYLPEDMPESAYSDRQNTMTRPLNVRRLIDVGAIRITDPAGDPSGEGFSVVSRWNDVSPESVTPRWADRPSALPSAINALSSPGSLVDGKYRQILQSARELGLSPDEVFLPERENRAEGGLADLHQKYARGGDVMSDEEYDRRLLERMKRDTGRTTESTNAEQARAIRSAGYDAAQLASDIFLPQSPMDAALMVALGPGGRMARLAGSTALMAMEPSEAEAIISPRTARSIRMATRLPQDVRFREAVEATPGASITDDGLSLEVLRYQKPEQAGAQAIREGVFYLPATLPSRSVGSYKGTNTSSYGGPEMVRGETLLRAPLAVPGNTGGRVPERAFRELTSDADMQRLERDSLRAANSGLPRPEYYENIENFLNEWGGNPDVATDLVNNSRAGNRMRFALQENVIGNRARQEGYDSIVGTGARTPRITEVFDLREAAYPVPGSPEFEMLLPRFEDSRYAHGGLAQLEHKYAEGGAVSAQPAIYDPDAVNTLANQIEAGYV
jgi:soluble lytic murein transglycosylase-like protein